MMSPLPTGRLDNAGDASRSAEQLSDEISSFWFPQLKKNSWPVRWRMINELCEQIAEDVADASIVTTLSGRIVAELINRLDDNPIRSEAQALTYRLSGDQGHVLAAEAWLAGTKPLDVADERRKARRHLVNREAALWVRGRKLPAVLVDVSDTGALLECRAAVSIGDAIELKAGWAQTKHATIVRGQNHFFGVAFS